MTTMSLRGLLAATFIVSTGLLTGMAAMPSETEAGQIGAAGDEAQATGLIDQFTRMACEVSLAATRRDRRGNRERSQQCQQ